MSEQTPPETPPPPAAEAPTHDQAKLAADRHRDIAQLLRDCVFPGALAMRVAASIQYLEVSANAIMAKAGDDKKIDAAEKKRERKQLKRQKLAAVPPPAAPEAKTDG